MAIRTRLTLILLKKYLISKPPTLPLQGMELDKPPIE